MTRRTLGIALVTVGAGLVSIGLAGSILGGGGSSRAAPEPAASPSPSPVEAESPEAFLDALGRAITEGDAAYLLARLHPEVIDLYGEEACAEALGELAPVRFRVRSVRPEPYTWVSDGVSREIADAVTVRVRARTSEGAVIRDVHVADADGLLRWFTDCGEPL